MDNLLEKIVALCKRRGFIYPGREIDGGLGGTWDYGPMGVELKRNIKNLWWKDVVQFREDSVGLDASIMMNPKVWEASGHLEAFTDPLVECKICHERIRADHESEITKHEASHKDEKIEWTHPQKFNLLVKAYLGVLEGKQSEIYLRGEITQGVHVNFKHVLDSTRIKIPFGIAQIGKAFRNEITPGNFTFRSREFEQMEVQFYIKPDENEGQKWYEYWKQNRMDWYLSLGMKKENIRYRDPHTNEEYTPWDIETSAGVDRSALFLIVDAYTEEKGRVFMKFSPKIAPYKAAVFPLLHNKPELIKKAKEIYDSLKQEMMVAWDERGNIGKRYASQDEIGTPYCITVDFDTLEDGAVTVRDRDTTKQERVKIEELRKYLNERI